MGRIGTTLSGYRNSVAISFVAKARMNRAVSHRALRKGRAVGKPILAIKLRA
jgi:hypothetical protein